MKAPAATVRRCHAMDWMPPADTPPPRPRPTPLQRVAAGCAIGCGIMMGIGLALLVGVYDSTSGRYDTTWSISVGRLKGVLVGLFALFTAPETEQPPTVLDYKEQKIIETSWPGRKETTCAALVESDMLVSTSPAEIK